MADFFQDNERFRRPEIMLGELLRKYSRGEMTETSSSPKVIHRAVVLAIDEGGGSLSGDNSRASVVGVGVDGKERTYQSVLGPKNPRNSVKAIIIDEARDSFIDESAARVLWPFFPPDQFCMPISPGEHIYTMFEDKAFQHGLWLFRISGQDDPNFLTGEEFFRAQLGGRDLNGYFDGGTAPVQQKSSDAFSTRVSSKKKHNDLFGG